MQAMRKFYGQDSIPAYAGLYLDADAEMPCKL